MSAIVNYENFSGGLTTLKRADPSQAAQMEIIDGFSLETGSLVPFSGATRVRETNVGHVMPWRNTTPPPAINHGVSEELSKPIVYGSKVLVAGLTGIHAHDPDTPIWEIGTVYHLGDTVVLSFGLTMGYKCILQHTATATSPNTTPGGESSDTYWTSFDTTQPLGLPSPVVAPVLTVASNIATVVHSCDSAANWSNICLVESEAHCVITASTEQYLTGTAALMFSFSDVVPDSHMLGSLSAVATANLSAKDYITASIYYTGADHLVRLIPSGSSPLILDLYNGADWVGRAWIPILVNGWNRVVCKIQVTAGKSLTNVTRLDISSSGYASAIYPTFYIDDIRAATEAELGGWEDLKLMYYPRIGQSYPLNNYSYRLCYESPRSRSSSDTGVVMSNPSARTVTTQLVGPGDKVTIDVSANKSLAGLDDGGDLINVAYYRADYTIASYEYLGSVRLVDAVGTTSYTAPSLVDTGPLADYSAIEGRPKYIETNHTAPSIAKCLMAADNCLYAACLDYDTSAGGQWKRPLSIARSTRNAPWYWPTIDVGQDIYQGGEFTIPAITGTEIRHIALLGNQKLVFLDSEMFIMFGDDNTNTGFSYVGPVGIADANSYASNDKGAIWLSHNGFCFFNGATIEYISINKIDTDLFYLANRDLRPPITATIWKNKYIVRCSVMLTPTSYAYKVYVFDMVTGGWSQAPCLENVTTLCVGPGDKLYGIDANNANTGANGALYEFMPNIHNMTAAYRYKIQTGNVFTYPPKPFKVKTAFRTLIVPGSDDKLLMLLVDMDCAADGSMTVTVDSQGKAGLKTQTSTVALKTGITQYEIPIGDTLAGRTFSVTLTIAETNYPPTIHAFALVTLGRKQR